MTAIAVKAKVKFVQPLGIIWLKKKCCFLSTGIKCFKVIEK